jgi:hypothetical protein
MATTDDFSLLDRALSNYLKGDSRITVATPIYF